MKSTKKGKIVVVNCSDAPCVGASICMGMRRSEKYFTYKEKLHQYLQDYIDQPEDS